MTFTFVGTDGSRGPTVVGLADIPKSTTNTVTSTVRVQQVLSVPLVADTVIP